MSTVFVRYKTSPTHADANEALVKNVFAELSALGPAQIRYMTLRLPDGVSFVHIADVENRAENPLTGLAAFKTFQAELRERCVEPPVVTEVTTVGSYGFGGAQ